MSLGENILKLRKESGLSQEKLGEKINVSRQTISNWELGETSPNVEQLKLISKELNVSVDELLNNNIELKQINLTANKETRKRFSIWKIVFLILCSPIWLSLLIVVFAILLSIYISLWAIIISFWAVFGSMFGFALAMILSGVPFLFGNTNLTGFAMISAGMVCLGLSILLFFGCRIITKGILLLTKKIILWIKKCLLRCEVI